MNGHDFFNIKFSSIPIIGENNAQIAVNIILKYTRANVQQTRLGQCPSQYFRSIRCCQDGCVSPVLAQQTQQHIRR